MDPINNQSVEEQQATELVNFHPTPNADAEQQLEDERQVDQQVLSDNDRNIYSLEGTNSPPRQIESVTYSQKSEKAEIEIQEEN